MDEIIRTIDREIVTTTARLDQLRAARKALAGKQPRAKQVAAGKPPTRQQKRSSKRPRVSREVAVNAVTTSLADVLHGRATQAKLVQATSLPRSAVASAVKELEANGRIRKTGEREGPSHVYERVLVPVGGNDDDAA